MTEKEIVSQLMQGKEAIPRQFKRPIENNLKKLYRNKKKYKSTPHFEYMVEELRKVTELYPDQTRVEVDDDRLHCVGSKEMFISPTCYFQAGDTFIGFCPKGENEIYIARLQTMDRGQGHGTGMMYEILSIFSRYEGLANTNTKVTLVCSGTVGSGEVYMESPVDKQINFFQKCGFEKGHTFYSNLIPRHMDNGLTKMTLNNEKCMLFFLEYLKQQELTKSEENDTIEYDDKNK